MAARTHVPSATPQPVTVDLSDFGAVGDGVTDDGPALQSALDALAASGGGTLTVPAGKYAIVTPVAKNFEGLATSIIIQGVPSSATVDYTGGGYEMSRGLDLVSEFHPQTGREHVTLHLVGLQSLLIKDIAFVGTPDVYTDAVISLDLLDIENATISHCEFYGLSTQFGGAIVHAIRSGLHFEQTKFLGCTANSGVYSPVVQHLEWKALTLTDVIFLDYGLRPGLFSKTGYGAPYSWVNIGNAAAVTADSPRREVSIRRVFLDEGGMVGLSSLPYAYQPPSAPIDLYYISALRMNVSNLGTTGHYLYGPQNVLIEDGHYGWSRNADSAIYLLSTGNAIIDRVVTEAHTTRLRADQYTGRLVVINSVYEDLASEAATTQVINTATDAEDPVFYVRQQFESALGREPDPAAHFYWSNWLLLCGTNAQCLSGRRAALATYLAASPAPNFRIDGRVTDQDGNPVADVTIALSGTQSVTTTTDDDGRYRFLNLPTSGVYGVEASKRHYTFATPTRSYDKPTGDRTADFSATINRHRISGRVADAGNNPVAGVTVSVSGTQSAMTTTDASGNYSFTNLKGGGSYTLIASKLGYAITPPEHSFVDLSADGTANFTASLINYTIGGRVTSGGSGMSGVTVSLSGAKTAQATTDAQGNYSFTVTVGDYTVTPSKRHYTFAPLSKSFTSVSMNQTADFSATLNRHRISGRATKSDGSAFASLTVTLSGSQSASATTDAGGNYSFTNLPAGGSYTVTPARANYAFTPLNRAFNDLGSDQTADFTGALVNYTISGRVTSDGVALSGVTLTLSGSQQATATSDADGKYTFTIKAEGNYTVTPTKTHYTFTQPSASFNNLGGNQTANFTATLNRHRISGRVTDPSGAGLAGVTVSLSGSQPTTTTTTDASGNYSFTSLAAGSNYTVTPSKRHYTFTAPSLTYNNLGGDQTANFNATLNRHTVSGRITKGDGAPIAGVTVTLSVAQGTSSTATTDASGNYSFPNLPAGGTYTFTPVKPNYVFTPSSRTLQDLSASETVSFTGALVSYTISGRVARADNTGLGGVTITLSGSQAGVVVTDSLGNYSFTLPAEGNYTLTPLKANYTFTPPSHTFTNLSANQSALFNAALNNYVISGRVASSKGAGMGGVTVTLSGSRTASVVTAEDGNYAFTVAAEGDYTLTPSKTNHHFSPASLSFSLLGGNQTANFTGHQDEVLQFSSASYDVMEGAASAQLTVTRTGDTSTAVDVDYAITGGTAQPGSDLNTLFGTLHFEPGETTQQINVFVTDDGYVESLETVTVTLVNPTNGAVLGTALTTTLNISDNDASAPLNNPIEDAQFFVRQHYIDFFGREPDAQGLQFWTKEITTCGTNPDCISHKRTNVSAAFFLSIEFQETGYYVYRLYKAAFGRMPRRNEEFLPGIQIVAEEVVVGRAGWQQRLEENKTAFAEDFVSREEFLAAYSTALTPAQFVDALNVNTGNSLTPAERDAAIAEFGGATTSGDPATRARVLRRVAENSAFSRRESNPAFVLMQYFAYLQRNPDDAPNTNLDGFNFWLQKLDQFGGDYQAAEMVKAFILSIEYRQRFGR